MPTLIQSIIVSSGMLVFSATSNAALVTFDTFQDEALWDAAVGASTVEDFSSLTADQSFRTAPVTFGNYIFSGAEAADTTMNILSLSSGFSIPTPHATFATTSVLGEEARIDFVTNVTAWGATISNLEPVRNSSFTVFDESDNPLGTMNAYDSGTVFYGFQLGAGLEASYIVFNTTTTDEYFAIDDMKIAAVPEPSALALSVLGMLALTGFRRRA